MKILMIAPQPFFTERGTPIAVRAAATVLGAAGHDVDLLVLHEGADIAIPGVHIIRSARPPGIGPVPVGFSLAKLACDVQLSWAAWRLINRKRYDVVHAVEEAVFPALAARRFSRFRLVWDMDSLLVDQMMEAGGWKGNAAAWLRPLEQMAARGADLLLPVCPAIAEAAARMAPGKPIHVLPDIAVPAPSGPRPTHVANLRAALPDRAVLALYVGNLEPYQGVDDAIAAMALLPDDSRVQLVVVGGTDVHRTQAQSRATAAGIADRVTLAGPMPLEHLPHLLAQADILLSPRRSGVNTPMKIYAYMASGRPIVATAIRSHDQVLDNSMAVLVPPGASDLASALVRLQHDPAQAALLGRAARTKAETQFSAAAFARRLLDAYKLLEPNRY
ncbi:glycosyltransferase family 4 protein [Croceicoccus sp. F390]|uniref:Glycosyltransferase family 4 protein n=1 Tax=Croceicoccus esteveae TaxID=3075597 RepID=A0ABU2ZKR0_9SPHN|nr:glycosyltransferase family 4 protein [Croceicoccus sp. F390]MDT0576976.1 glycosyltransferase family 4 protein [Croceicoccus sp. F390]